MRIFNTKWMARFARRERISNASLIEAIQRAEAGQVDADLGGGLIKQRVAREGQGRSGGYRMILAFRVENRAVFMFGFAKSDQENIGAKELEAFRTAAAQWLEFSDKHIETLKADGAITEIEVDDDEES